MKNKKLIRKFTVLLAALVIMCGFSVTAYAGGGDESDDTPTPVTEETPAPETAPEETTGGYEPVSYTHLRRKGGTAGMYFTKGKQRAFELLMQQKPSSIFIPQI